MERVIAYETSYVWQMDIVRDALKRARLPFQIQTEGLSGLTTGLDALPVGGFGTRWVFIVPEQFKSEAQSLIESLHVTDDSDTKGFRGPFTGAAKKKLWVLVAILLCLFGLMLWSDWIR
jgi:hypothetical protein